MLPNRNYIRLSTTQGGEAGLLKMHTRARQMDGLYWRYLPLDFIKAIIMVYIAIPFMGLGLALRELFCCKHLKESKAMPGLKLFEQFGEAIPQV